MIICELPDDQRHIKCIRLAEDWACKVGDRGITHIEPYDEPSPRATQSWFAVFKGDFLSSRVNAALVAEVTYFKEFPEAPKSQEV